MAQLLAMLPARLRAALEQSDEAAFQAALGSLSPEEQPQVLALLMALQRMMGGGAEE